MIRPLLNRFVEHGPDQRVLAHPGIESADQLGERGFIDLIVLHLHFRHAAFAWSNNPERTAALSASHSNGFSTITAPASAASERSLRVGALVIITAGRPTPFTRKSLRRARPSIPGSR